MSRHARRAEAASTSAPTSPSGTRRARAPRRPRRTVLAIILAVVLVAGLGLIAVTAVRSASQAPSARPSVSDYSGAGHGSVVVTIPEGASSAEIARLLVQAGVVATEDAFADAYAASTTGIQAGTYTLRLGMSAANAVAALLDPASRADRTLTVPEGCTREQVKERLMSVGGFSEQEVETAFSDAAAIGLPEVAGGQVEGWLAPSTYDVAEDATATDVVASMVSLTLSRLTRLGVAPADYEQVLTKASVVEHEVASSTYYGQVARVIENRLASTGTDTAGRLQMDSTVLYGLGRTGGVPTSEEVRDRGNPYNTYVHAGLPPTPIGSPGELAIAAVVSPPQGAWLYFVTINLETGETLFASTQDEQQANTERLTAYCREHEDMCSTGGGS
ncbi:endolytic transglycosylase MltG [Actinomyces sp. W5033]|uniref:endolytic transglycosylase MltG n=1 Tax=Actinomyces sp. W5033 TaxID=3446479 RepID=UPI003EE3E929